MESLIEFTDAVITTAEEEALYFPPLPELSKGKRYDPDEHLARRHLKGKHNQKAHGHDGGAADGAAWKWEKSESVNLGPKGSKTVIKTWSYKDDAGKTHEVRDFDSGFSEDEIDKVILPTFQRLQETNPADSAFDLRLYKEVKNVQTGQQAYAITMLGSGSMSMSGSLLAGKTKSINFNNPEFVPSGHRRPMAEATLIHEWGHVIDRSKKDPSYAAKSQELFGKSRIPGRYAKTNVYEAHAEAFAENYMSGGKTAYADVLKYGEELGWQT